MSSITIAGVLSNAPQFYKTRDGDVVALLDVVEKGDEQTTHYHVVAVNQIHSILAASDYPFPRSEAGPGSRLLIQGQFMAVPTEAPQASPILIADSIGLVGDRL